MSEFNKYAYGDFVKEDGNYDFDKLRAAAGEIDEFWITMTSIAVDCNNKQMKVRFFEDPGKELVFSFTDQFVHEIDETAFIALQDVSDIIKKHDSQGS